MLFSKLIQFAVHNSIQYWVIIIISFRLSKNENSLNRDDTLYTVRNNCELRFQSVFVFFLGTAKRFGKVAVIF